MQKISEIKDFYSQIIDKKNSFKNKINKKVLIGSLNKNLDENNQYSPKHHSFKIYNEGNENRFIQANIRVDTNSSYAFLQFIRKELSDYIFGDRKVSSNNPIYRHPLFLQNMKGLDFVIASNIRTYKIPCFDGYGRVSGERKEEIPIMRISIAHASNIKRIFFADTYNFKVIKKLEKNKDFNLEDKIEVYLPMGMSHPHPLDSSYHMDKLMQDDEGKKDFYKLLNEKINYNKENNVEKQILNDTSSFEKVILETTILQELYEELLLNIEKRFKSYKENGDKKNLNNELDLFSQFVIRNPILLDAFLNLTMNKHDFMLEMDLRVLRELSNGYVPFLTNYTEQCANEIDEYYSKIITIIEKVKINKDEFEMLLLGIVRNISTLPISINNLNENKLNFLRYLKNEINHLEGNFKISMEIIFNEQYPIDLENIRDNKFSLFDCLNVKKEEEINYKKRNVIYVDTKEMMMKSVLMETPYLKCKYQEVFVSILKELNYDLMLNININDETYLYDASQFYQEIGYNFKSDLEIAYLENEIKEKELLIVINLISKVINTYIENNNIENETIYKNKEENIDDAYKNELILSNILLNIRRKIDNEFIDFFKNKVREEILVSNLTNKTSSLVESRKKI